jgi:hypothetical protein
MKFTDYTIPEELAERMKRHSLSIIFNSKDPIDIFDDIAKKHNSSRTETFHTLLEIYNEDEFNKALPNAKKKMADRKKALLDQAKANRRETRRLATLLNNNPELLEKLKKELANEE